MLKFYEKHESVIVFSLIIIYLVINTICLNLFGNTSFETAIINFVLSGFILSFIYKNNLKEKYGLIKIQNSKDFLYFIPLLAIVSVNLWNGINIQNSTQEIIAYILTMIGVGFLEEIIFRGFLFRMMEKDNLKAAIIVNALTFGVGHIINLLNGADLIPTLIQICYATAIGYLFVMIFYKGKSLLPCIIAHCTVNSLSIFNIDNTLSLYIVPIFVIIVSLLYTAYINKKVKLT